MHAERVRESMQGRARARGGDRAHDLQMLREHARRRRRHEQLQHLLVLPQQLLLLLQQILQQLLQVRVLVLVLVLLERVLVLVLVLALADLLGGQLPLGVPQRTRCAQSIRFDSVRFGQIG
jgi:hypothetical protein